MTKKRILLVQFRTQKRAIGHEKKCIRRYIQPAELEVINVLNQEIRFSQLKRRIKEFQGVILGGSAEFNFATNNPGRARMFWQMVKRVKPFIQYLIEKDIPTLGICFGHQFLGYVLGARVIADKSQQETGSFFVSLTPKGRLDPLFSNLPSIFICQFGHKDSLEKLPSGATLLAKTKRCKVASFRYKKCIYGVQFHPEMTLRDIKMRLKFCPDYKSEKMKLLSSPYSQKVLKNFYNLLDVN